MIGGALREALKGLGQQHIERARQNPDIAATLEFPDGLFPELDDSLVDIRKNIADISRPEFATPSFDPFSSGLMSLNPIPQPGFDEGTDFNQLAGLLAGPMPQMQTGRRFRPPSRSIPAAPDIMQDPNIFGGFLGRAF